MFIPFSSMVDCMTKNLVKSASKSITLTNGVDVEDLTPNPFVTLPVIIGTSKNTSVRFYFVEIFVECEITSTIYLADGGPITYIAPEDKDVWFCLCKRTKHRPFCDGSHRDEEIQNTVVEGKIELFEPFEKKKK